MTSPLRPHRAGVVLAGGGMLLISFDSLGIRLSEADSWDVAFWIGAFTALAMNVVVPIRSGSSLPAVIRRSGWPLLASGALSASSFTLFVLAINLTTVANTVVIIAAIPIVAAVMARIVIAEQTSPRTWVAIGLSVVGMVIVVSGSLGAGRIEGDLAAVAAILAFAANLTLWRRFPGLDRQAIIGLGGALAAAVAFWPANPFEIDGRGLAILAVLGLVTGPAGRVAVATATRYLSAARVGLFAPVETVAAITWAWIFLDEAPEYTAVVGGAIVVSAVLYGTLSE